MTLRHDTNVAYVAAVPNANLPKPDAFRGNTNLRLGDDRYAFVGGDQIVGINILDRVDKFNWRHIVNTNGETNPKIPRPKPVIGMPTLNNNR